MDQLDINKTDKINEKQFVQGIIHNYTDFQLTNLLNFDLIPNEILEDAHKTGSLASSKRGSIVSRRSHLSKY
jgi:hypothetical protein